VPAGDAHPGRGGRDHRPVLAESPDRKPK
jgi:hypothetical protein